jgi:1,4-dihydroxy-2-naphthoate octaprenyltransferase
MDQSKEFGETVQIWLLAARPRTLALALASVILGNLLAVALGPISILVTVLTLLTAILLQVLSNLANDYGDSVHGADRPGRAGPSRAVQSGRISAAEMRRAVVGCALLAFACGAVTLWLALGAEALIGLLLLGMLGVLAVWAAVSYTAGAVPYGYAGLGDLAVFGFFGWVGVLGSFYLQTIQLWPELLLPATSSGLFAVAVLNINNIRDMESDHTAGKRSLPVRLGLAKARLYHWALLTGGLAAATLYVLISYGSPWQFLYGLTVPLLLYNGLAVSRRPPHSLDPMLRQMSLSALLFAVTFGVGQVIA